MIPRFSYAVNSRMACGSRASARSAAEPQMYDIRDRTNGPKRLTLGTEKKRDPALSRAQMWYNVKCLARVMPWLVDDDPYMQHTEYFRRKKPH